MFIDASAIVAIIKREPDADALLYALDQTGETRFSSPIARFEATVSLAVQLARAHDRPTATANDFKEAENLVSALFDALRVKEIELTEEIGEEARRAAQNFGKVSGHPAKLNMGDCFAYAAAKTLGMPLLYKGDDFSKTDLA
ncbi:MAG: type II toxin-antitoxin system VapC family toxin [Fulvimarina manganoxydans]|uniref:type II toxin-antitoxin system VapC family toxin n=1 Tax=Fulvimarina manganoxydans TaxID=937218 RepID=UPI002351FE7B|nr:type II toxin-antitoxin system VapC family toxin [Fulvimarina manganoxydans]MCK5933038.1 type II toxin-antitoxin system VapC family toxin [Fulvimarina manganoxydans]